MPIIYEDGDRFWIEQYTINVTLLDAAGRYDAADENMIKIGAVVGMVATCQQMINNDNAQAVGSWEIRDESGNSLPYGERATQFRFRVVKQVGTAGSTVQTWQILLFKRASTK